MTTFSPRNNIAETLVAADAGDVLLLNGVESVIVPAGVFSSSDVVYFMKIDDGFFNIVGSGVTITGTSATERHRAGKLTFSSGTAATFSANADVDAGGAITGTLADVAGLTPSAGAMIVGDGSNFTTGYYDPTVIHPRAYGAYPGATAAANTTGLQAAIDAATNIAGYVVVQLEAGGYAINATIGIDVAADMSARVHIKGAGRRATYISWSGAANGTVLQFKTTVGNLRDIVVDDLMITGVGADYGLVLDSVSYCLFRNITVRDCDLFGVRSINNSGRNTLEDFWWVHLDDANALSITSGNIRLVNPMVGEDAGGFYLGGGTLYMVGGHIEQAGWAGTSDPASIVANFGARATFHINQGNLHMDAVRISAGESAGQTNLFNLNDPGEIVVRNCRMASNMADGVVFAFRSYSAADARVQIENNYITLGNVADSAGSRLFTKVAGADPSDVVFVGNTVLYNSAVVPAPIDGGYADNPNNQWVCHSNLVRSY